MTDADVLLGRTVLDKVKMLIFKTYLGKHLEDFPNDISINLTSKNASRVNNMMANTAYVSFPTSNL